MNLSPTTRKYLISFSTGLVLTALTILAAQFAQHPDGNVNYLALGYSILGGIVLFARDWLTNNSGAWLENIATPPVLAKPTPPPSAPTPPQP